MGAWAMLYSGKRRRAISDRMVFMGFYFPQSRKSSAKIPKSWALWSDALIFRA
jgi:hypothetical protein